MQFSVCIPSTRPDTLAEAIRSVQQQHLSDWELIVVAQGAHAAIEQVVAATANADPRIRCVRNYGKGACVARNTAIQASSGAILAFIDDDCEAHPEWLSTIAERFARDPALGVVSGALVAAPDTEQRSISVCPSLTPPETVYDPIASGRKAPAGWGWVTANVAIKRSVIQQIGLFDSYLGPGTEFPASEESDYILRLERAGVPMAATPNAIVYHTYGRRYGVRAVYKLARNYAAADGGCAAKLTLLGDPRGEEWCRQSLYDTLALLRSLRLPAFTRRMLRYWYFIRAYRHCLRVYRVDASAELLYLADTPGPEAVQARRQNA